MNGFQNLHDIEEAIKYKQSMCIMEKELDPLQLSLICIQWRMLTDKEKEVEVRLNILNWFFGVSYFAPEMVRDEINFLLLMLLNTYEPRIT